MADVHDKATRSYNMSRIKGANTKPEMLVRKFLHAKGLRYILYNKKLPGKPDLTLTKYKTVIFVNGCFWHGHDNCKYAGLPKTRKEFWSNKIEGNKKRDQENIGHLKELGWNVLIVHGCELKREKQEVTLNNILQSIQNRLLN